MSLLDPIVLTADKNTPAAIGGLLSRPRTLGIRATPATRIVVHPRRDPAVLRDGHNLVRQFVDQARFCLVVFDREGSGELNRNSVELEQTVQSRLDASGWRDRSAVVVIDPELEVWVWSDSPVVAEVLGWKDRNLREWLAANALFPAGARKPPRPKEAVEAALRASRTSRSSALYSDLARRVSFRSCADPVFARLRSCLAAWFPA